jgi:hypothetical protein
MNPTFQKFNYPASLARDYVHWAVGLIRQWHLTLGGLIIAEKSDATALSQLDPEAFLEFGRVCRDAEGVLARAFQYDKVNYVSLMMAGHQRTLPCHPALRLGARVSQCRIYRRWMAKAARYDFYTTCKPRTIGGFAEKSS